MKRELTMTARATTTVAPLLGVLGVLYATGAVGQASPVVAAAVAALVTAVLVEPFRSTWTRGVFVDQQRVQFCAQAMIALEAAGDLVQDIMLTYHPNWRPRLTPDQKDRADQVVKTVMPVIGLAKMWAPKTAHPLDVLVEEIRDAGEFGTPSVDYVGDAYPGLRKALAAAREAINGIRRELPS